MTQLADVLDRPDSPVPLKVAIIEGAAALGVLDAAPAIARLRTDPAAPVRVAALRALGTLGAK
jgi:HEAT repeat protein